MRELGFKDIPVRFFIYDGDKEDINGEYGEYVECTEHHFLEAEGIIEYERFTVRENGSKQICLTKNPFI